MRDVGPIWRSLASSHRFIALTMIAQVGLALVVVANALPAVMGTIQSSWSPSGLTEERLGIVRLEEEDGDPHGVLSRAALATVAAVPGVTSVVSVTSLPLEDRASTFNPSRTFDGNAVPQRVSSYAGTPATLSTLGLRLIAGRDFTADEYRHRLAPHSVIVGPETYADVRRAYLAKSVRVAKLLGLMCAIVILTMGIGVATLAGYWIAQRSGSIAVRRALGASRCDIARYFLTEACLLSAAGVTVGAALTYLGNDYLRQIMELRTPSPMLLAGTAAFFVSFNLLAIVLPVRRAVRRQPAEVFRLR